VNPITHLELVPRLEIPGDTPPYPHTLHGQLIIIIIIIILLLLLLLLLLTAIGFHPVAVVILQVYKT